MKRITAVKGVLVSLVVAGLFAAVPSSAGPDKIAFPANWKDFVLYTTIDRYDVKQYRELYASSKAAVDAAKAGQPLPAGTVLVLIPYKAQVDAAGNPVKDANGRFVKGDIVGVNVMEKRAGWGAEYPAGLRNGEWEYAAFSVDGKLNDKANYKGCFECHKPHEKRDFVISYSQAGGTMAAAMPSAAKADVTIANFAFGPNKVTVAPGKPVTWVNTDGSPHQIAITSGTPGRSEMLLKGQSHTQSFATAGVYDYMCGLHPSMKGQIEVK
ncbi:MAG: cytochrome P460 family protein [Candidatus Rokubacteria bacterium]|nr:cytochrome P460 family protein [Candidatus Rokubacteria bacterium]